MTMTEIDDLFFEEAGLDDDTDMLIVMESDGQSIKDIIKEKISKIIEAFKKFLQNLSDKVKDMLVKLHMEKEFKEAEAFSKTKEGKAIKVDVPDDTDAMKEIEYGRKQLADISKRLQRGEKVTEDEIRAIVESSVKKANLKTKSQDSAVSMSVLSSMVFGTFFGWMGRNYIQVAATPADTAMAIEVVKANTALNKKIADLRIEKMNIAIKQIKKINTKGKQISQKYIDKMAAQTDSVVKLAQKNASIKLGQQQSAMQPLSMPEIK